MTDGSTEREWPDYTPLRQIVIDSDGMLALDFPARVGARPYLTFEDGEWRGVSVGPFDSTEDGETVITTTKLDVDWERVTEMLQESRVVQLRSTQDTPLEEHEDWVYRELGDGESPATEGTEADH